MAGTSGDPPVRLSTNLAVRRLVNRIAPDPTARSEDGMIVVSIPLKDLAAEPDSRS